MQDRNTDRPDAEGHPVTGTYTPGDKDPKCGAATWARKRRQLYEVVAAGGNAAANVPCGDCTACCRGDFRIKLTGYESVTLDCDRDPETNEAFLRRQPNGDCRYLVDGRCATYRTRPQACRIYDCRGMAICGIGDPARPLVQEAIQRWSMKRFTKTRDDLVTMVALRTAVKRWSSHGLSAHGLVGMAVAKYKARLDQARRQVNEAWSRRG